MEDNGLSGEHGNSKQQLRLQMLLFWDKKKLLYANKK